MQTDEDQLVITDLPVEESPGADSYRLDVPRVPEPAAGIPDVRAEQLRLEALRQELQLCVEVLQAVRQVITGRLDAVHRREQALAAWVSARVPKSDNGDAIPF